MNVKGLSALRRELARLRRARAVKPKEIIKFAESLGRHRYTRGKHPTWINPFFADLRPVSIPLHGSKDLNRFTKDGILDQLELDLERLEKNYGSENKTQNSSKSVH